MKKYRSNHHNEQLNASAEVALTWNESFMEIATMAVAAHRGSLDKAILNNGLITESMLLTVYIDLYWSANVLII